MTMKSSLKYIKIDGYIKNMDTYFEDTKRGYRVYKPVMIVDNDGTEVLFDSLSITTRMDGDIRINKKMTFYILRYKQNERMMGSIYATDDGETKVYHPKESKEALYRTARHSSKRARFVYSAGPQGSAMSVVLVALIIAGVVGFGSDYSLGFSYNFSSGLAYAVLIAFTTWFFMSLFDKDSAEVQQAETILEKDGFIVTESAYKIPDKY